MKLSLLLNKNPQHNTNTEAPKRWKKSKMQIEMVIDSNWGALIERAKCLLTF